jgi:precorrin-8X/cobalt-precorrin-8 methylmutase
VLFDTYLIVDWSANSVPKIGKDSIWIGEAIRTGGRVRVAAPRNPSTRSEACALIAHSLGRHVDAGRRVLFGCDFAYAYPRGFTAALALDGSAPPWSRIWRELARLVTDGATNANNRWSVAASMNRRLGAAAGPFWGCPRGVATPELCIGKGRFPHLVRHGLALDEYRTADLALRRAGRGVQSVWKLFTIGSVGSQTLLGIPRLHALRHDRHFARCSRVWPFETGFTSRPLPDRGPFVVHAEIWPRIVPDDGPADWVLDARQVTTLARHFATLDANDNLGALFDRPPGLAAAAIETCRQEEGWVLGA